MHTEKMPGVTLVALFLAYTDVVLRFVEDWSNDGSFLVPIALLSLVICIIFRQNWARIIWTFLNCCGILVMVASAFSDELSDELNIGLSFSSIVFCVAEIIFLWHPKTNEWFDKRKQENK